MDFLDLNADVDRRVFIKGLGGAVGVSLIAWMLGGCESCKEQIAKRPLRRRIRSGSAEVSADLATYRDAVAAMKALPSSDPRSWERQAAIHGTVSGGFNLCQHGTDHFFSWHRAYLVFFEQICQQLTGNKNFGLPYWNWNQNPVIHPDFLNASSPLFHPRDTTDLTGFWATSNAALDPIFPDTNFYTFSSQLEGTPHNMVHTFVGGEMGGGGSARDPLFWTHHCMVDYAWAKWSLELGNSNPNDAAWSNETWNHFFDGAGNAASSSAGLTTLMPLLSYQYESSAIGSFPAKQLPSTGEDFKKLEQKVRKGANVRFNVSRRIPLASKAQVGIAQPFNRESQATTREFANILEQTPAREHVFASVQYAQLPDSSDFFVRVFVNLPTADAATPLSDAHFAGSFAFFGTHTPGHEGHHAPRFLVNLTATLRRLRAAQQLSESTPISVQLVAVPAHGNFMKPDVALVLDTLELIVTPVIVNAG